MLYVFYWFMLYLKSYEYGVYTTSKSHMVLILLSEWNLKTFLTIDIENYINKIAMYFMR